MLTKKRIVALCATTFMGVSALSSVSQVMADVTQEGETRVIYQGATPQPVNWGISVPSTVNMDTKAKTQYKGQNIIFGNSRVAIVKEDGSNFIDPTKNRVFKVSADSNYNLTDKNGVREAFYVHNFQQGVLAPTDDMNYETSGSSIDPMTISVNSDGSGPAPFVEHQFGIREDMGNNLTGEATGSIAWTATEKV